MPDTTAPLVPITPVSAYPPHVLTPVQVNVLS